MQVRLLVDPFWSLLKEVRVHRSLKIVRNICVRATYAD